MNIIIKGNHLEITEAINDYSTKRLEGLTKFLSEVAKVELELSKTSNHHKSGDIFRAEINITNKGDQTYAAVEKEDLYAAIDQVRDDVIQMLATKKDKKQSLWKWGKGKIKGMLRMETEAKKSSLEKELDEKYSDE